jgi:hypothetical protein
VKPICRETDPEDRAIGDSRVACHFAGEVFPPVPVAKKEQIS